MANICCDDVIFYTEGNPEGLYDLWEDLETYIILNQNPDLCWIGNLFSHKKIDSTGISLRGNVSYMEWNDTYILLSLETAWTPLYEAYQAIAAAYHVPFVMQSIEPGERIYYNTDEAHLFFPDRYCVRLYEESLLTPCGLIIGEKLEDGEPFETETDVLERFRDCGYPAATLKELELIRWLSDPFGISSSLCQKLQQIFYFCKGSLKSICIHSCFIHVLIPPFLK